MRDNKPSGNASGHVGCAQIDCLRAVIQADANKQRSIAGQDWRRDRDPARSSRAVKEYLATLDDTAWGAASDVVPKFVSPAEKIAVPSFERRKPARRPLPEHLLRERIVYPVPAP
jgi:hypothetical protein